VLLSDIFIIIGVMSLLSSLVLFVISLFISRESDKIQSSQGVQEYNYNFTEHQNYWDADK
jgi:hypothetical protein